MRVCRKCSKEKPSTKEFFYTAKDVPGGLKKICKECEIKSSMKRHEKRSISYKSWTSMKSRCYNQNSTSYKNYGARGIRVCDRWMESFDNFIEDMGERPSLRHSIDRIDNDGDYTPGNCKWATPNEQGRNQRMSSRNTSGYRGVSWYPKRQKWNVRINTGYKRIFIGEYENLEDAIEARKQAELKYWN